MIKKSIAILQRGALLTVLLLVMTACQRTAPIYEVAEYEATFTVLPAGASQSRDVAATLTIRYDITRGPKADGFKFVGTLPVRDVQVTDGEDQPLAFELAHYDEQKITWHFAPVERGAQTVIVHFVIEGALKLTDTEASFAVEWVKNWRVPVRQSTYRLVLSAGPAPTNWQATPSRAQLLTWQGRPTISVQQSPVGDQPFTVRFTRSPSD